MNTDQQIKNDIESKTQIYIRFADNEYKRFNLYDQDQCFIDRFDTKEISNVVMSDDDRTASYETKRIEEIISAAISRDEYNEILSLQEISDRKFNTDRIELASDLTLDAFLSKYFR